MWYYTRPYSSTGTVYDGQHAMKSIFVIGLCEQWVVTDQEADEANLFVIRWKWTYLNKNMSGYIIYDYCRFKYSVTSSYILTVKAA